MYRLVKHFLLAFSPRRFGRYVNNGDKRRVMERRMNTNAAGKELSFEAVTWKPPLDITFTYKDGSWE